MENDRIAERIALLMDVMMGSDDEGVINKAGRKLASMGGPAIPILTEALKSDDERRRISASIALAMMGDKATPAVGELMKSGDVNIKLTAMVTLAMMKSAMEEDMPGETVDSDKLVKRPVKCPADRKPQPVARKRPG